MKSSVGVPSTSFHSNNVYQRVAQLAFKINFLATELKYSGGSMFVYKNKFTHVYMMKDKQCELFATYHVCSTVFPPTGSSCTKWLYIYIKLHFS